MVKTLSQTCAFKINGSSNNLRPRTGLKRKRDETQAERDLIEANARKMDLEKTPYYQEAMALMDEKELVYQYIEQRQLMDEWIDNYCNYEVPTYVNSSSSDEIYSISSDSF